MIKQEAEPGKSIEDAPPAEKKSPKKRKVAGDGEASGVDKPKVKKPKRMKDKNAPHAPLNGYVRFLAKNRERVRDANPETSFPDVTKLLAAEWTSMPIEQKQCYLDEAEKDKERYQREIEDYRQTDSFKMFQEKQQTKKDEASAGGKTPSKSSKAAAGTEKEKTKDRDATKEAQSNPDEIPIFTEEFLEHNRCREGELRHLRKLNTEYEEQNAILSKHVESLRAACEKFESESALNRMNTKTLEDHITSLGALIMTKMGNIAIPGSGETPTPATIESYLTKLHQSVSKGNKENEALAEKVQSLVVDINPDDIHGMGDNSM